MIVGIQLTTCLTTQKFLQAYSLYLQIFKKENNQLSQGWLSQMREFWECQTTRWLIIWKPISLHKVYTWLCLRVYSISWLLKAAVVSHRGSNETYEDTRVCASGRALACQAIQLADAGLLTVWCWFKFCLHNIWVHSDYEPLACRPSRTPYSSPEEEHGARGCNGAIAVPGRDIWVVLI